MTDLIDRYFSELVRISNELPSESIERIIDILMEVRERDGTVFIMGNGGSASTASHFASDLAKGTIVEGQKRFRTMSLGDNVPLVSAWSNDSGFGSIFAQQLEPWIRENDVLIGISVHGGSGAGDAGPWSQNLVQALTLAKERRAKVIGLSGFDGGALKEMADECIVVPMDTEPLGTALIESVHVVLHHLICVAAKQRILASAN